MPPAALLGRPVPSRSRAPRSAASPRRSPCRPRRSPIRVCVTELRQEGSDSRVASLVHGMVRHEPETGVAVLPAQGLSRLAAVLLKQFYKLGPNRMSRNLTSGIRGTTIYTMTASVVRSVRKSAQVNISIPYFCLRLCMSLFMAVSGCLTLFVPASLFVCVAVSLCLSLPLAACTLATLPLPRQNDIDSLSRSLHVPL